jgi:ferritin-like metal-binding protein YciE
MADNNPKTRTDSYLTDMLSLEHHIKDALETQLKDQKDYPDIQRRTEEFLNTVEFHISSLEGLANARDAKGGASTIKKAGSKVLGVAAGTIDLLRHEGMPKDLRDNYTAFSLASIGYVMLHTTAASLDQPDVAALAERHLADYQRVLMTINHLIPAATIAFLKREGLPASEAVLAQVADTIDRGWRQGGVPEADQVRAGAARPM